MRYLPFFMLIAASLFSTEESTEEALLKKKVIPSVVSEEEVTSLKEEKPEENQLIAATADVDFSDKVVEDEMEALRKWIRDKRLITVKEIGGQLSLSGEVRVEFQDTNEKRNGVRQRGSQGATKKPSRAYDVEVNIMLDYRTDRTWASIKLEYDNDMGQRSGTMSKIALEKAYFGGRIIDYDTFTFDGEIGRRFLGNVFSSKIEFGSLFDGALLRLSKAYETIGDLYINGAVFLIDDSDNQYGYVGEIGLLRALNTGLQLRYSIIDWRKDFPNELKTQRYRYIVSQGMVSYLFRPNGFVKLIKPYAGLAVNHIAEGNDRTRGKKANIGFFAGVSLGQVRKQGDWAIDTNYQQVEAQAIPDYDASGIGRGNAAGVGFYTEKTNGSGAATTNATAVGSGNFKGFRFEFLYAITNNLTLLQCFQISHTLDKNIGPDLKYKQFEIEMIYAF